jgi:hypothetical protein
MTASHIFCPCSAIVVMLSGYNNKRYCFRCGSDMSDIKLYVVDLRVLGKKPPGGLELGIGFHVRTVPDRARNNRGARVNARACVFTSPVATGFVAGTVREERYVWVGH